jgi:hypothetical protein
MPTQLLHQCRVAQTDISIAQRINTASWIVPGRTTWLVCNSNDLEAITSHRIDKVGTFDRDGLHSECETGAECD